MRTALTLLLLVGTAAGCYFAVSAAMNAEEHYDISSGKVVFETTQEYGDFKRAIADPEVTIEKMDVYSSDPPIVVDFEVTLPDENDFTYGTKKEVDVEGYIGLAIIAGIFIPVLGGSLTFIVREIT